nr:PAAR domain-containing protein [Kibdelosporangium sp. MJ126-NF4]CEL12822.1 predicted protein [Kibdelosporangium sp. MJ126-NF4]CTQ98508.1 predicted protein [Kibdelosporangium sp. MJ126-NF4]
MSPAAAKLGDQVVGVDTHIVLVPSPTGPVPTPMPLPFDGKIVDGCSSDVLIEGAPAAIVGSGAVNEPVHIAPSGEFETPPTNRGTLILGSPTVLVNGKPLARDGDRVTTCNDPVPEPTAAIVAVSTVLVG